ncbi:MAG: hypothetical protein V3S64_05650 [bacterium]
MASEGSPPDFSSVEGLINQCFDMAKASGARPDLGITHFRYAEILHKKGDLNAAQEQLAKATTLFREMEMIWWLEQAKTLRRRLERGDTWKGFAPYAE